MLLNSVALANDTSPATARERNPQVRQAIEDLAQRESITSTEIEVVSVEEVVWPDSSLGCPQPGMRYLQVLQDGMRIVLSANGRHHSYHSGGNRAPFLCAPKMGQKRPTPVEDFSPPSSSE